MRKRDKRVMVIKLNKNKSIKQNNKKSLDEYD